MDESRIFHEARPIITSIIRKIEIKRNIHVVYWGIVGSVSQGIADEYSDYDVKCLYVLPDSPKSYQYHMHDDCYIHFKEYFEDDKINCIAFWEIHAFIGFLSAPWLDNGRQYDLFRNVYWLLCTPYADDSYGLREIIYPLWDVVVDSNNEKIWHTQRLIEIKNSKEQTVQRKKRKIEYETIALEYIDFFGHSAPISIYTMKAVLHMWKSRVSEKNNDSDFGLTFFSNMNGYNWDFLDNNKKVVAQLIPLLDEVIIL